MENAACRALLMAVCVVTMVRGARGADTQPATRPENIDKIVKLAPITIKTKGLMPKEAFEQLQKDTGITFSATQRVGEGFNGRSKPIDLWNDGTYAKLDFDLEGVWFWQAVDRLNVQANLRVTGGDGCVVLFPGYGARPGAAESAAWDFDNPIARVHASATAGSHSEMRLNDEPPVIRDVPPGLRLSIDVDPRVTLCWWGDPVVEVARDGEDQAVEVKTLESWGMGQETWNLSYLVGPQAAGAMNLKAIRGYVPVTVVTASKPVTIPLEVGTKVVGGDWTIELVDFQNTGSNLGSSTAVFIGIERSNKNSPAVLKDSRTLVHLVDAGGKQLVPDRGAEPRVTVSGGVRERLSYWWATRDQTATEPAMIVVDVPTETKTVAIPFEFKDVKLP